MNHPRSGEICLLVKSKVEARGSGHNAPSRDHSLAARIAQEILSQNVILYPTIAADCTAPCAASLKGSPEFASFVGAGRCGTGKQNGRA